MANVCYSNYVFRGEATMLLKLSEIFASDNLCVPFGEDFDTYVNSVIFYEPEDFADKWQMQNAVRDNESALFIAVETHSVPRPEEIAAVLDKYQFDLPFEYIAEEPGIELYIHSTPQKYQYDPVFELDDYVVECHFERGFIFGDNEYVTADELEPADWYMSAEDLKNWCVMLLETVYCNDGSGRFRQYDLEKLIYLVENFEFEPDDEYSYIHIIPIDNRIE